jgi:hypothetical protein
LHSEFSEPCHLLALRFFFIFCIYKNIDGFFGRYALPLLREFIEPKLIL